MSSSRRIWLCTLSSRRLGLKNMCVYIYIKINIHIYIYMYAKGSLEVGYGSLGVGMR